MKGPETLQAPGGVSARPTFVMRQKTILIRGVPTQFAAVEVNGQNFIISGKMLKTANLGEEGALWLEDVDDPETVIAVLKSCPAKIDMLRFWQRIPESEAKFQYYKEWRYIAALPISTYEHWCQKQVNRNVRRNIKKASAQGVVVSEVPFTDDLARGIMGVFNQSPVRRGKPFWHYGKDFETVKREMGQDMKESIFIAAHYQGELIGIIKLYFADRYAMVTLILDKTAHRDKAPMNGMIAKAVEICAARGVPFMTYTVWRRGTQREFLERNGFTRIPVPEYFIPLSWRGRLALLLRLHRGPRGLLPEKTLVWLLAMRAKWYAMRYPQQGA
jgi:hypothetical protein